MKFPLILVCLACISFVNVALGQKADTVIDHGIYKSYYSYRYKAPLYVTYTLFKGGGDCDRGSLDFKRCGVAGPADEDYAGKPYDKGHLANAEDFAGDCEKLKKTFCYDNCAPQTVKLNRGIWKSWETTLRALSQTKRIFIIAGNIYGSKTIGRGKVGVPAFCYKIVVEPETHKTLYCLLFENDTTPKMTQLSLAALKQRLGYELVP